MVRADVGRGDVVRGNSGAAAARVIEQVDDRTWFVRRDAESSPEAIIERFAGGYRLRRFSLTESRRTPHGVHMSLDMAETAWWRIAHRRREC